MINLEASHPELFTPIMSLDLEPDELETLRDNLAKDIEERTELLKSIVKDKYRDISEASEAIQSMKLNLKDVEKSLWSLDRGISEFYTKIKRPNEVSVQLKNEKPLCQSKREEPEVKEGETIMKLTHLYSEIWQNFDSGNLERAVQTLNEAKDMLESNKDRLVNEEKKVARDMAVTLTRAEEMIKNSLWHRVQFAEADQIGIIAGSDQEELYQLSLKSSLEYLVEKLQKDLLDTSSDAQLRRRQTQSYFNTETNEIDDNFTDSNRPNSTAVGYVQIPKLISPELGAFLYGVCKVINTIAGFNLDRSSIVGNLRMTIEHILQVYESALARVDLLKAGTKRKRALQLYYDLLYVRILLNTSKNIDLLEKLDPKLNELASKYELMLDSIELYMISSALHTNVVKLSQRTIRLYGLLIPHLE